MAFRIVIVMLVYLVVAEGCADFDLKIMNLLHHNDSNPCSSYLRSTEWITFQKRMDGSVDFFRNWDNYVKGFGSVYGEYWIGLDNLRNLTRHGYTRLLVVMEDTKGNFGCAAYESFFVGSSRTNYTLAISDFSGNAGDSLSYHNGMSFSTKDYGNSTNCAKNFKGAWWYKTCHQSNLNGLYLNGNHTTYADGINWRKWKGHHYSLKSVKMMLSPPAH